VGSLAFYHTMGFGYGGILVDFPVVNKGAGARTQGGGEAAIGARPTSSTSRHDQILGWKVGKGTDGKPRFMQLRCGVREEDDGQFGTEDVEQVRVLEPGKWETWREKEQQTQNGVVKEWALHERA
jgi:hypothetical protein